MLPQAQEHCAKVDAKARAERAEKAERENSDAEIQNCRDAIAQAECRKQGPFFTSAEAEETFRRLKNAIEIKADQYVQSLCTARATARPVKLDLASEEAMAFFFRSELIDRLHELAERINRGDRRYVLVGEEERARIIAKSDAEIADKRRLLESLLGEADAVLG